jgi:hypothetical protein
VFIQFMPLWAQDGDTVIPDWLPVVGDLDTNSPGAPAVVFGGVLILLMFVLPTGVAGLVERARSLTRRRA